MTLRTDHPDDRAQRVTGRWANAVARAVNRIAGLRVGDGLRQTTTPGGDLIEVDRDAIRDPQILVMQTAPANNGRTGPDASATDVILAHPVGNPDNAWPVAITTPEQKEALLGQPALDQSTYANAYEEFVALFFASGAIAKLQFVAYRMGNSVPAVFGTEQAQGNVYWFVDPPLIQASVLLYVSGDPWIYLGDRAIDSGQTDTDGNTIFLLTHRIQHKQVTDTDPNGQYDQADTGKTDEVLCRFSWSSPTLSMTPVTLEQDDAGHIHAFNAGSATNIDITGTGGAGADEKVAVTGPGVPGYLDERLVLADDWLAGVKNGNNFDLTHEDPQAQDWAVTVTGDAWISNPGADTLSVDAKGHLRNGANVAIDLAHGGPSGQDHTYGGITALSGTSSSKITIEAGVLSFDSRGHERQAGQDTADYELDFTGDSWITPTVTDDAQGANLALGHAAAGSTAQDYTQNSITEITSPGTGVLRWVSNGLSFDAAGHDRPTGNFAEQHDVTFTGDSSIQVSVSAAGGNGTVALTLNTTTVDVVTDVNWDASTKKLEQTKRQLTVLAVGGPVTTTIDTAEPC